MIRGVDALRVLCKEVSDGVRLSVKEPLVQGSQT